VAIRLRDVEATVEMTMNAFTLLGYILDLKHDVDGDADERNLRDDVHDATLLADYMSVETLQLSRI
jgi:hypothetical protein